MKKYILHERKNCWVYGSVSDALKNINWERIVSSRECVYTDDDIITEGMESSVWERSNYDVYLFHLPKNKLKKKVLLVYTSDLTIKEI